MFPNQSSSYEISSKTNAFVQINEEDKTGGVNGKAQPHISDNPALQVPDDRDKMVVVKGADEKKVDPILTVITNHPSQAPTQITSQSSGCERKSDGSSIMPQAERKLEGALCFDSINCTSNNEIRVKDINLIIKNPSQSETLENIPLINDDADFASFKICDYYSRWGIPRCMKLYGGGESSLTGTAGWGTPPTSTGGSATGWTGGSSSQPQQTQQQGGSSQQSSQTSGNNGTGGTNVTSSQWGSNNNSSSAGNNNGTGNNRQGQQSQQQGSAGGQSQQQGPPSQSQAPPVTSSSSPTTTSSVPNNANGVSNNNNNNGGIGQQQTQGVPGTQQSQQQGGTSGQNGPSWAAAAGKGLPPTSQSQGLPSSANSNSTNAVNSTKQQMEQLNTMREALFSQDGWGGQNVNQDSNWDIPGSPEPGSKDNSNNSAVPLWKLPINNGTDLWEANLRNGGMPPPQSQTQKTPWGHTPSSNIGGTWGEDDEGDASNVWTGIPPASGSAAPQWPNQPPIWPGGAKKDGDWGGPNWNDQRDPRDLRHNEMRPMMDNRESLRPGSMDHRSMGGNDVLMRGDPRGISGRLNGVTSEAMWPTGPTGPHHHMAHHQGKLNNHPSQPGVNQWGGGGGPPIKDMGGLGSKTTGWEEPSPPAQRRTMPNYDDGTSLWGQQHSRPAMPGQNKVSHWKEMPTATGMGRGSLQCPPGRGNPNIKPDQPLWPHHPRNGGWSEGAGMDVGSAWAEEKPAPWMDQTLTPSSWAGGPKQHKPSWDGDLDPSSWVHPTKQPTKTISKEMIWASKQFRILSEMGFKKEEVENTLRASGMNLEDALEQLSASRNIGDRWRHSELDPDHPVLNPYPSQICLAYQPNGGGGSGSAGGPNVLANSNQSLSTLSPAIVQKLLSQQPPPQQQPPFTQQSSRTQPTQQPSPQQLRMLVQQIQMAVQSGYLSPQILNQPLAPQTLILLNQLLQQIKNLQQLSQHHVQIQVNPLGKPSNSQILQISVQITKTKQQICNLQNQIAAQQAVYVKHQQQTPPTNDFFKGAMHEPISALHSNFSDLTLKETQVTGSTSQQSRLNQWKLPALDKDSDMGSGNDFSRAPGSTAKATPGSSSPNINPLLGQPDGTWSSVTRSNCDTGWPDSGADEPSSKDWPTSTQPPSQVFSDLVPEFEPGKPWKGNPLKSIEDDPSLTPGSVVRSPLSLPSIKDTHILSSSSSVPGKASPTTSSSLDIMPPIPSLSLSSSTWSFNPPVSTTNGGGLAKLSGSKSSNTSSGSGGSGAGSAGGGGAVGTGGSNSGTGGPWGEAGTGGSSASVQATTSELWVTTPKSRGPPPGLPAKPQSQTQGQATTSAPTTNGWGSLGSRWPAPSQAPWPSSQPAAPTQAGSTWLLLRNLTPQIDGSTLKTLCLQHGPLQNFHLYLNHGIALAKYTSREEANKAQGALNNCVLGNTTIFAESPSESDVMSLLQHLGHSTGGSSGTSGGGGGSWRTPAAKEPSWAWGGGAGGAGAPGAGTATSLWAEPPDQHRTTPSSINSFLPGDLLGGESI